MLNKNLKNIFNIIFLNTTIILNIYSMQTPELAENTVLNNIDFSTVENDFFDDDDDDLIFEDTKLSNNYAEIIYQASSEDVKSLVKSHNLENINIYKKPYKKNILLHGKFKSGKSTTVKMLAKKMNKKIVFINAYCFHSANEDEKLEDLKTIILPIIKCKEPYIIAFRYFDLFQEKIRDWLYTIIENENICFIISPYEKIEKIDARFRDNKIFEEIRLTLPKKENRKKVIEYIMSEFKKETKKMNIDLNYDSLDLDYASKQTKGLNFFKIKNFLWDLYNDAENYAKNKTLPGDKINVVINKNIFDKTLKPYKKNISKFDIDNDLADEESENTSHITNYCSIISILCVSSAIIYYLIKKKNTKKNISKSCLL